MKAVYNITFILVNDYINIKYIFILLIDNLA